MNFSYKMLNHILMKFYILRQPLNQTGDERIELPLRVLETPVIPLDQSPI
jgi:hypothetical protein